MALLLLGCAGPRYKIPFVDQPPFRANLAWVLMLLCCCLSGPRAVRAKLSDCAHGSGVHAKLSDCASALLRLAAGLWQLAAAVDVIDFEELSFGKLLGAGELYLFTLRLIGLRKL